MDEVSGYAGGDTQGIEWLDLYISCKGPVVGGFFFGNFIRIK